LGRYLYKCRIKVIDPDCFPTNKFENEIRSNDWPSIPMFSLLLEYFKFNFRSNPIVNKRSKHQLITDQMSNLYFILRLYIGKVVIDKILREWDNDMPTKGCDPGTLPFSDTGTRGYVFFNSFVQCPEDPTVNSGKYPLLIMCSVIIIIPMFFIHVMEFREVYFKIGGTSRKTLQGNLVRKFLNYDESSRAQLGPSDLIMAMTRDTQSLVHDGYMQLFPLAQNLGKLAMMVAFQLFFKATYACIFCLLYPIVLGTWLACRNKITTRMSQEQDVAQNELVNYVTQIMTTYRLIGDYLKRPDAVEATEARVGAFNKRMVASDSVNLNNRYCCQWLSLMCIASWFMFGGRLVIRGESELGMFVTNLQIFGDVGQAWTAIFNVMLKMQNALPYLQKIVRYMNLPIDLEKRMRVNRKRRTLGEEARKLARAEMQRQEAAGVCLTGAFAADYVPISLIKVGYSYDTPQAIYKRMLTKDKAKDKNDSDDTLDEGQNTQGSLANCTFSFGQGKLIALVGRPGDGKSTLMKILGSQIIPDSGDFLIPPHLRALHISAQPTFFNDTLMNNLIYGVGPDDKVDGSAERVTAICKMLDVSDKVLKYINPDDKDMFGVKADWGDILSQTQRALVSLARAFIANPEILVIHKPTVVFDDSTTINTFICLRKFVVEKGLCMDPNGAALRRPRTCIITTSRPRGVAAADHVFQIKPDMVIEMDKNQISGEMLK
jgi:ABC-type multidrug transport system fused ATPase/permease subunit